MRPRQTLLDIFSTFLQFDTDRAAGWATDSRLRRSMQACLAQSPAAATSRPFWELYWHQVWQKQPGGLARSHLIADLQEACYWAAQKTAINFAQIQYGTADCFQAAIARIDKILLGFNPVQGHDLKSYASTTFRSLIREFLRQRQVVDICSDWALLRKLSQKRLVESLQTAGLAPTTINAYILAWQCFKTIYVPTQASSTRQLSKPDGAAWDAIARLYNAERHSQLSAPGPSCTADSLERWLLACVRAARAYLYPTVASINAPKPGRSEGEFVDDLVGEVDESLLSDLIEAEERQTRSAQRSQIHEVLTQALAQLDPEMQQLLELYYAQGLTQQEIAKQMETKQYTISRRFTKARELLLRSLAQWSQETLHISLTSDVLKHTNAVIEEWLVHYYRASSPPA